MDKKNLKGLARCKRFLWPLIIFYVLLLVFFSRFTKSGTTALNHDHKLIQMVRSENIDGSAALEETRKFITISPRISGTEKSKKAVFYLAESLRESGLNPVMDVFTNTTPDGNIIFRNLIGFVNKQKDKWVIIASHYDTKYGLVENFTGANDSGSSTGLLLEMAKVVKKYGFSKYGIMFAFLDGEECRKNYGANDGLHGSRRLISNLEKSGLINKVRAVIVLDMIGDKDLTVTIPENSSYELMSMVFKAARKEGQRLKFSMYNREVIDDHVPFLNAGLSSIDIIDFEYGSMHGINDYWHNEEDSIDKLSADSLQLIGSIVIRVINNL